MDLIDFSAGITPEDRLAEYIRAHDARRALMEALLASAPRTFTSFAWPIIRANEACLRPERVLRHLTLVSSDPQLRLAYDRLDALAEDHASWVRNNADLFEAYQAIQAQDATLGPWERAWLEARVLGYEQGGLSLPQAQRDRLSDINKRLSELGTQFRRNLQDASDAWSLPLTPAQVEGIPANILARFADLAKRLDAPAPYAADLSVSMSMALLGYCQDRQVRQDYWYAYHHRCVPGGVGEAFDNLTVALEILALRHEKAALLGYVDFAAFQLADKMAQTPQAANDLLLRLRDKAKPKADEEWRALNAFAQSQGLPVPLMPWDTEFVMQLRRKQLLGVDAEEVAGYFPYEHALCAMLEICSEVFGVSFEPVEQVSTWHPSVSFHRVRDQSGALLGGFYIDPFARPGKKSGAWKSVAWGALDGSLPLSHICCNFSPPTDHLPALLQHKDLTTLLHEFGHCLHHLLSLSPIPDLGTRGVERDAIECPSQLLENFAWDRGVLQRMSRHHETGQTLPDPLLDRMLAGRHDVAGLALCRQLTFGLADLAVHSGTPAADPASLWAISDQVRAQTHPIPLPAGDRMLAQFAHIFSGGYAAGYYGYLWAEVLSADAFSAFAESPSGILDPQVGLRFRQEVLAMGALRPFNESFEAFRGRPLSETAMLQGRDLL